MIKVRPVGLVAAVLLVTTVPAYAAKTEAANEVTLHIDADAAVAPDRAEMTLPLTGKGATRELALRDFAAKQASITSALASAGITGANVKTSDPKDDADAAAMEAVEASEAINGAAMPGASSRSPSKRMPVVAVSGTMTLTIDDLKKLNALQGVAQANGIPLYMLNYGGGSGRFYSSDPAAARKSAREQAVAKAHGEADAYAAAMGYHVVRMIHASNTSPPFNMRDMQKIAGYADMARNTLQPSFFASAAYATVAIDYVIAPN